LSTFSSLCRAFAPAAAVWRRGLAAHAPSPLSPQTHKTTTKQPIKNSSVVLIAALFCSVFTVASVSRLTRGGAIPDTRSSAGGDGALDVAAAAEAEAAAVAEAAAFADPVPDPIETGATEQHQHTPHGHVAEAHDTSPPRGLFALVSQKQRERETPVCLCRLPRRAAPPLPANLSRAPCLARQLTPLLHFN
jgi:hypothetical protein